MSVPTPEEVLPLRPLGGPHPKAQTPLELKDVAAVAAFTAGLLTLTEAWTGSAADQARQHQLLSGMWLYLQDARMEGSG